jgi:hypothetical protein
MSVEIPHISLKMKKNINKKLLDEYKEEIHLHLLHINIKREAVLSFILMKYFNHNC